jgi:hypothetical protein
MWVCTVAVALMNSHLRFAETLHAVLSAVLQSVLFVMLIWPRGGCLLRGAIVRLVIVCNGLERDCLSMCN